eukprot:TRINITY_DN4305_c0_g1_i2.p1 TRINITY_DN4305_c0_g1~~TRINITY_DN4305_c0_g1_i2.p1  ORF type:complete len:156 (+),score=33.19 TRINITY_DN4305_c0_g1_i2:99-566(+)
MLRSLVGSEMCIRDRCRAGWGGWWCTEPVCHGLLTRQKACSDHGSCESPDQCSCDDGWTGQLCDIVDQPPPPPPPPPIEEEPGIPGNENSGQPNEPGSEDEEPPPPPPPPPPVEEEAFPGNENSGQPNEPGSEDEEDRPGAWQGLHSLAKFLKLA